MSVIPTVVTTYNMKKILILNVTLNKGGAARVAHNLFADLDHNFDIIFEVISSNDGVDSR